MRFVDFVGAFDIPHRELIWKILRLCGVPTVFVDILMNVYNDSSSCVCTQDGVSPFFIVKSGLRQGCILSLILFNLVLDWVLKNTVDENTDGIFIGPSPSRQNRQIASAKECFLFQIMCSFNRKKTPPLWIFEDFAGWVKCRFSSF